MRLNLGCLRRKLFGPAREEYDAVFSIVVIVGSMPGQRGDLLAPRAAFSVRVGMLRPSRRCQRRSSCSSASRGWDKRDGVWIGDGRQLEKLIDALGLW
jgi:hypothetical protein